jgi:hypothetical protein
MARKAKEIPRGSSHTHASCGISRMYPSNQKLPCGSSSLVKVRAPESHKGQNDIAIFTKRDSLSLIPPRLFLLMSSVQGGLPEPILGVLACDPDPLEGSPRPCAMELDRFRAGLLFGNVGAKLRLEKEAGKSGFPGPRSRCGMLASACWNPE